MPGWIIPAPLQTPPTRTFRPPHESSTAHSFLRVSLVMIASANSPRICACRRKGSDAASIPFATFAIGKGTPIRPVDATKTSSGLNPSAAAASSVIRAASFIPCSPVQALALPELTTTACALPAAARRRQSLTGAAATWLVVNNPAALAGTSDRIKPKSRFFPLFEPFPVPKRLMSQNSPEARKPAGAVTDPGIRFRNGFINENGK